MSQVPLLGTPPDAIGAASVYFEDTGGGLGGGSINVQDVINAILAGTLGAYLRTTLGGVGVVQNFGTLGATQTLDLANANKFKGTLAEDCTLTSVGWTNLGDCWVVVQLTQDATGGWLATFDGVTWDGGAAPFPSTAPLTTAFYLFHSDDGGTTIYGWLSSGGGTSGSGGMVPYLIESGETFTVPIKKQGLFSEVITVDAGGTLVVDGHLNLVA